MIALRMLVVSTKQMGIHVLANLVILIHRRNSGCYRGENVRIVSFYILRTLDLLMGFSHLGHIFMVKIHDKYRATQNPKFLPFDL